MMSSSELKMQWTVALTMFFNTCSVVRVFCEKSESKPVRHGTHCTQRMLAYPYRCSSCTKVSEKLLTFSNVVSYRATLILYILDGHLYHLKKVREKRNSDLRGDHNLCERRQNKKTKKTCTEIPVSGEVLLFFQWQRKSSVGFRPKRWCVNHIFALNLQEGMFNNKNTINVKDKKIFGSLCCSWLSTIL